MRWLLDRLPKRVIMGCETPGPYLTRYFLLRSPWLNVYLHEFHRSDEGRDLHDHPWNFLAVILRGGYWEWTTERHTCLAEDQPHVWIPVRRWHRPGSFLPRKAGYAHRVEVDPNRLPWSLVIVGPRVRKWGFYTPAGWVHWKAYLRSLGCLDD